MQIVFSLVWTSKFEIVLLHSFIYEPYTPKTSQLYADEQFLCRLNVFLTDPVIVLHSADELGGLLPFRKTTVGRPKKTWSIENKSGRVTQHFITIFSQRFPDSKTNYLFAGSPPHLPLETCLGRRLHLTVLFWFFFCVTVAVSYLSSTQCVGLILHFQLKKNNNNNNNIYNHPVSINEYAC